MAHFSTFCPRCRCLSEVTQEQAQPKPKLHCGVCLMKDVEIVPLKVIWVEDESTAEDEYLDDEEDSDDYADRAEWKGRLA